MAFLQWVTFEGPYLENGCFFCLYLRDYCQKKIPTTKICVSWNFGVNWPTRSLFMAISVKKGHFSAFFEFSQKWPPAKFHLFFRKSRPTPFSVTYFTFWQTHSIWANMEFKKSQISTFSGAVLTLAALWGAKSGKILTNWHFLYIRPKTNFFKGHQSEI